MNHLDRSDPDLLKKLLKRIRVYAGPPLTIMEVCGTHTVSIARMGLSTLLPEGVSLLSGPGCPVCVTPIEFFDEAIYLAREKNVVIATYGDAMRVPGSGATLLEVKAEGGQVHPVYSTTDALNLAIKNKDREVVFLGLGFETTAPTVAHALLTAKKQRIDNFSVLSAHKVLLPAMEALLLDPEVKVNAFLCPGHASMVLGWRCYEELASKYGVPSVVAGFEPHEILLGINMLLAQAKSGGVHVENAYPKAVSEYGNTAALDILGGVFKKVDSNWRGLGLIPGSGYDLADDFAKYDAREKFLKGVEIISAEPAGCRCADVLRGVIPPAKCPLFASRCNPKAPVGACMVSSEGACGAHYRYREA
ncbi:MAG: hydrogenase formation protein HypD [Deltaproteobacteria bacterium]|nr:MAG: hydrogenase formation protein HypD [Deltaproteobacteria bacterium]